MTAHFNIDKVVKHVKTISDNNRCGVCDKLSGDRLRYPCGHTICGECVVEADECLTCTISSKTQPAHDPVQGQLVENVSNLLKTFQEAFNIDVYRRYRLSEKLKIENQLFPDCIQASVKYYNKRRSTNLGESDNKENLEQSFFAGEELNKSDSRTMNTRINLVQKWLEKNEKVQSPVRKPFSDINVNHTIRNNRESKNNKGLNNQQNDLNKITKKSIKNNSKSAKYKKITKDVSSPSLLNYCKDETLRNKSKAGKRLNIEKKYDRKSKVASEDKYDIIDIQPMETIVIEDTQTQADKDKAAWLQAVEKHQKESNYDIEDNIKKLEEKPLSESRDELRSDFNIRDKNVSYYKKAYLFKSCHICIKSDIGIISSEHQRLNSNNVSITINTKSISSTITVSKDKDLNDEVITKHSIKTQTDDNINIGDEPKHLSPSYDNITSSPDLFVDDDKKHADMDKENINDTDIGTDNSQSNCVMNDSDSDVGMDSSGPIKVSVDVHRSHDMEGILCAVDAADTQCRVRRSARRPTVDSNNSSEKENLEPNRIKRRRLGKKPGLKK